MSDELVDRDPSWTAPVVHWGNLGEGWEYAEEALALVQADLTRTVADAPVLGFAWTVDQWGKRDVFVGKGPDWYFGANGSMNLDVGDGVLVATVVLADAVQDAIVDTLLGYLTYWPRCPEDGGLLRARDVDGQARWLCERGEPRDFGLVGELALEGLPLDPEIWTPAYLADGRLDAVDPGALPMLAAEWLAADYDSEQLREVAALSASQGAEARSLLPGLLSSLGVQLQGRAEAGRLTRRQFLRILEQLAAGAEVGHTPRQVTHEVVTLWWSLPESTDGEVTGIEDLDDLEYSLIVRLYGHYCDATDEDMPSDLAERAATQFWSTLGELLNHVQSRQG